MPSVGDLFVKIGAKTNDLEKGLKKSEQEINGFNKTVSKAGNMLKTAFVGIGVVSVGKLLNKMSKLAGEAEGITAAFEKLNQPGLLDELQKATRGTVSNMELMRKAVQANNFKIPLEKLGTFFEFATKRAIETGESVDFLVNSLVTGIGRKSVLVMDNLGISAIELQEEVKKVGDFGAAAANIIERELGSMGEVLDTTKTKEERLAAQTQNLQVTWGSLANNLKNLLIPALSNFVTWMDEGLKSIEQVKKAAQDDTTRKAIIDDTKEVKNLAKAYEDAGIKVKGMSFEEKAALDILEQYKTLLINTDKEEKERIRTLLAQIDALERLAGIQKTVSEEIGKKPKPINITHELEQVIDKTGIGFGDMEDLLPDDIESTLVDPVDNAFKEMKRVASINMQDISSIILSSFGNIADSFASGSLDMSTFFSQILIAVADFGKQFGAMLISTALAAQAFKELLLTNPPAAIAAGVALVGLSALTKGLINKGIQTKSAATGADFVTAGPTALMVGDNPGGREHVQVTPLGSPNINGKQTTGQNIGGQIVGVLRGSDIDLILKKYNSKKAMVT
jgi:hypothetical protein